MSSFRDKSTVSYVATQLLKRAHYITFSTDRTNIKTLIDDVYLINPMLVGCVATWEGTSTKNGVLGRNKKYELRIQYDDFLPANFADVVVDDGLWRLTDFFQKGSMVPPFIRIVTKDEAELIKRVQEDIPSLQNTHLRGVSVTSQARQKSGEYFCVVIQFTTSTDQMQCGEEKVIANPYKGVKKMNCTIALGGIGSRTVLGFEQKTKGICIYLDTDQYILRNVPQDRFYHVQSNLEDMPVQAVAMRILDEYIASVYTETNSIDITYVTSAFGSFGARTVVRFAEQLSLAIKQKASGKMTIRSHIIAFSINLFPEFAGKQGRMDFRANAENLAHSYHEAKEKEDLNLYIVNTPRYADLSDVLLLEEDDLAKISTMNDCEISGELKRRNEVGDFTECSPYQGHRPYVFISYSHKNMMDAFQIIRNLRKSGYLVWYDEGIDPGSEWDENIASHVENCGFFVALLSKEYLNSSNCKDELNYARDLEKPRLLIYLDDVQLPSGMRMRLSRLQAIHKYKYNAEEQFYEKLYASQGIDTCLDINSVDEEDIPTSFEVNDPEAHLRLICVVDTSGSMAGERIHQVNKGLKQVQAALIEKHRSEIAIDILQYDTNPRWRVLSDLPLASSGVTNVGRALKALYGYGNNTLGMRSCAIVFINDGMPTDRYQNELLLLQQESWFATAVKTGIAIDEDNAAKMLADITGSQCAVISLKDIDSLSEKLYKIAVASIRAIEINCEQRTSIEGRNIIDWLDELDNESLDAEIEWSYTENGTLSIRSGAIIPDYYLPQPQTPWGIYREQIRKIILESEIRIIGMHAFYDMPYLEEVVIPQSVTDIRVGAFGNCPKLATIEMLRQPFDISDFKEKRLAPQNSVVIWPNAFDKRCEIQRP